MHITSATDAFLSADELLHGDSSAVAIRSTPGSHILRIALVICCVWAGSATAATLSRDLALRLIRKHPAMAQPIATARIGSENIEAALLDGIVVQPGAYEALTDKGRQYFTSYSLLAGATLRRPVRAAVTAVTGIRDTGNGSKVAVFTWHIENLDAATAQYTLLNNADQSGEAAFRMHDDGWRIVAINPRFKGSLPNSRPLSSETQTPTDKAAQTQSEICALVKAWRGAATDFNTYYLYEYGREPPVALDDRKDGVRTVQQIRRAFVPTYMHPRRFPATDPYGNPYIFKVQRGGTEFVIISRGADGKPSGDDLMNVNGRWMSAGKMRDCS